MNEYVSCLVVSNSLQPNAACQAPLSVGFSRQEYWNRLYFLLQGIFPNQGSNPGLLHCRQIFYHLSHQGSHNLLPQMVFFESPWRSILKVQIIII